MNERYDINGNAYRVKTTLDDGAVLGHPLYLQDCRRATKRRSLQRLYRSHDSLETQ
jgi:hypothetical protein